MESEKETYQKGCLMLGGKARRIWSMGMGLGPRGRTKEYLLCRCTSESGPCIRAMVPCMRRAFVEVGWWLR